MQRTNSARRRRAMSLSLAAAAVPFSLCSTASAASSEYWKNADTTGNWSNGNDWSASSPTGTDNAGVPGSSTNVYIANTNANTFTITLNQSDTILALDIDNTGGGSDTLSQTSAYNLNVDGIEYVGYNGTGSFNQSAGTDAVGTTGAPQDLVLANSSSSAVGTYTLSGSSTSLTVTGAEVIGWYGSGTFNQSGGTHTVGTTTTAQALYLGLESGSKGNYALSGGTLTVNGSVYIGGTSTASGGTGTLTISGGSMTVSSGITIYSGGTLNQTAGTFSAASANQGGGSVSLSASLYVDSVTNPYYDSVGSYSLGGGTLTDTSTENSEVVGGDGAGTFSQTGGVNNARLLIVGNGSSGVGTYSLSVSGSLAAPYGVTIGGQGAGTFNQNGGTLTADNEAIGEYVNSAGAFSQTAGVNTVTYELDLGQNAGSNGTYLLSGTGSLSVGSLWIGGTSTASGGTGTLTIGGGSMTVTNGITIYPGGTLNQTSGTFSAASVNQEGGTGTLTTLNVASSGGNVGSYALSGGSLTTTSTNVGTTGSSGTFTQTNGTHTVGTLTLAGPTSGSGLYDLQTGTLTAQTININSGGELRGGYTQNYSFNLNATAVNVNTGGQLQLGDGPFGGSDGPDVSNLTMNGGTAGGAANVTGTYDYISGNTSGLSLGVYESGNTVVNTWTLHGLNWGSSNALDIASGSSVQATEGEFVASALPYLPAPVISQTGGANATSNLLIGANFFYPGTYLLSGGSLSVTNNVDIPAGGTLNQTGGTFTAGSVSQEGGSVSLAGTVIVDSVGSPSAPVNVGSYSMSGGTLAVNGSEDVGWEGAGTFNQSGGSATAQYLSVGTFPGSNGNYLLSGTASLAVTGPEYVGNAGGNGTFTQSGGSQTIGIPSFPQTLYLAYSSSSSGTYNLSSTGSLTVNGGVNLGGYNSSGNGGTGQLTVGDSASATVTGGLSIWNSQSSVSVTGGALSVGSLTNYGSLSVSGGALTIASGLINNGTTTLSGGVTSLTTIDGTGTFAVTGGTSITATYVRQGTLSIDGTSTVTIADSPAPGTTTATSVLTDLNNSGTLDLKNNDVIINDSTQFAAVRAAITNAYNGGAWNMPGITSSSAKANPNSYGLGYAQVGTGAGSVNVGSFDGQAVSSGATLVKYTLLGDALLSGTVGLGDYNIVLANLNTGTLWAQGAFHPGTTTGLGDYNAVVANLNATASGTLHSAIKSDSGTIGSAITSALASDLTLEVNATSGDVYALASAATALTGYDIYDKSASFLDSGDPNTDLNERLLSQPSSTATGNQNQFRNATNYKLWVTILDNTSTLAEGQNNGKLKQGTASTYDTINIPAGGTIDFGDIYSTATNNKDLTFSFSEADSTNGGNPVTGSTYSGVVTYVGVPEPTTLGVLGLAGVLLMRRRRPRQSLIF